MKSINFNIGSPLSSRMMGTIKRQPNVLSDVARENLPAMIIPGGMGHIGSHAVIEGVKRGWEVYPCSRTKPDVNIENSRVKPVVTPSDSLDSADHWYDVIQQIDSQRQVVIFNCIGNPDAADMEKANVRPAHAISKAVKMHQSEGRDVKMVQASSIAAFQLPDFPYGRTKLEAEEAILAVDPKDSLILRIGYAVDGVTKGTTFQLNTTHAYDAPHLVAGLLPGLTGVVPIIGDGKQKFQPVAIKDIVEAVFNFAQTDRSGSVKVVDGVGRQAITQQEFYQTYADLIKVKLRPIFFEADQLKAFAREFPMGHLSEYAIEGLSRLMTKEHLFSADEFEELLGKPTQTLKELYANTEGNPIEYARPPVGQHLKEIAKKICKCSKARKVFMQGMKEIVPPAVAHLTKKN